MTLPEKYAGHEDFKDVIELLAAYRKVKAENAELKVEIQKLRAGEDHEIHESNLSETKTRCDGSCPQSGGVLHSE